jgi:hypothetical protein
MPPTPSDVQSIFGRALEIESSAARAAYLDEAEREQLALFRREAEAPILPKPDEAASGRKGKDGK